MYQGCMQIVIQYFSMVCLNVGFAVAYLIELLCYKAQGGGFDS
jgi:hypothetical protein